MGTTVWIDALAGVAGDMLAGAFIDAGVPIEVLSAAVAAVLPDAVELSASAVQRNGLHATKFDVAIVERDAPHRHLADIRAMLDKANIDSRVRESATAVFERLGAAEAAAHGVAIEAVHFHEVGAADSISDIVAVCAALDWLDASEVVFSDIALGSGTVRTEHGELPVPTPAALRLTEGLSVFAGGKGELATPTGIALLATLGRQDDFPRMRVTRSGAGAGTKDFPDRANVVRVVIGEVDHARDTLVIECNVDDMDPRLWPAAIDALMSVGAADAWLTPIVMKKGRPAHTLTVLCARDRVDPILDCLFVQTSTIGARVVEVNKIALDRAFARVSVDGHPIAVKIAGRAGRIYNVSLEFEDVARAAGALGLSQRLVLERARLAASESGYITGAEFTSA